MRSRPTTRRPSASLIGGSYVFSRENDATLTRRRAGSQECGGLGGVETVRELWSGSCQRPGGQVEYGDAKKTRKKMANGSKASMPLKSRTVSSVLVHSAAEVTG